MLDTQTKHATRVPSQAAEPLSDAEVAAARNSPCHVARKPEYEDREDYADRHDLRHFLRRRHSKVGRDVRRDDRGGDAQQEVEHG